MSRSAVKPVSQNRVVTRAECGHIFDSYAPGPNPGFNLDIIGQKREMHFYFLLRTGLNSFYVEILNYVTENLGICLVIANL